MSESNPMRAPPGKGRSIVKTIWQYSRLLFFRVFVTAALAFRRKFGKHPRKTLSLSYEQSKFPSWWSPNTVDVFYPALYSKDGVSKKLPLFIDIHGGGFAIGDPTMDGHFCRYLSDAADCVVITLPYRFSPFTRFPTQIHDLAALVQCILSDPRVTDSVDTTKVAIGGFSAGGNLSTAVTLLPEMQGKIQSLVPIYPVLDFTILTTYKLSQRPPGRDILANVTEMFRLGYVPYKLDCTNPLLSPMYANPDTLPDNIYIVGAELDLLNYDAKEFTKKFQPLKKNFVYEEVPGMMHGFTHMAERARNAADKAFIEKVTSDCYDRIAEWLGKVWNQDVTKPDEEAAEELGGEGVVV